MVSPSSPHSASETRVDALYGLCQARFALRLRGCATRSPKGEAWWSQTGSNRRPHACKARALPAELWPRTRRRMLHAGCPRALLRRISSKRKTHSIKVVGLGRLELPTSRLSSARSNQLSYKPLARIRPRRKRNEDGEIPPMELNNPETVGP